MEDVASQLVPLEGFYREQTGKEPVATRLLKLSTYLAQHRLTVDDVVIVVNWDRAWSDRSNRTELERRAALIGSTARKVGGLPAEYFWVVPLDLPRVRRKLEAAAASESPKKKRKRG